MDAGRGMELCSREVLLGLRVIDELVLTDCAYIEFEKARGIGELIEEEGYGRISVAR